MEAQEWVAENPDAAAVIFAGFTKVATAEQLAPMLRSHTHHHHPVDGDLKQEIALYAQELKQAGVFKSRHRSRPSLLIGSAWTFSPREGIAHCSQVARDQASAAGRARHDTRSGGAGCWRRLPGWRSPGLPHVARCGRRGTGGSARRLHGDDRLRVGWEQSSPAIYVDLPRLFRAGPWLVALALLLGLWELVTRKT